MDFGVKSAIEPAGIVRSASLMMAVKLGHPLTASTILAPSWPCATSTCALKEAEPFKEIQRKRLTEIFVYTEKLRECKEEDRSCRMTLVAWQRSKPWVKTPRILLRYCNPVEGKRREDCNGERDRAVRKQTDMPCSQFVKKGASSESHIPTRRASQPDVMREVNLKAFTGLLDMLTSVWLLYTVDVFCRSTSNHHYHFCLSS